MNRSKAGLLVLAAITGITLTAFGLWTGVVITAWVALIIAVSDVGPDPDAPPRIEIKVNQNGKISDADSAEFERRIVEGFSGRSSEEQ